MPAMTCRTVVERTARMPPFRSARVAVLSAIVLGLLLTSAGSRAEDLSSDPAQQAADDACANYAGVFMSFNENAPGVVDQLDRWRAGCEQSPNQRTCELVAKAIKNVRNEDLLNCQRPN